MLVMISFTINVISLLTYPTEKQSWFVTEEKKRIMKKRKTHSGFSRNNKIMYLTIMVLWHLSPVSEYFLISACVTRYVDDWTHYKWRE